jgi:hypothetical protein
MIIKNDPQSEVLENILKEVASIIDNHSKQIELLNNTVIKQNELINILHKEIKIVKEIK